MQLRLISGGALLLYVVAKLAKLYDHEIAARPGVLSGHTLKDLLATAAAALIVTSLVRRIGTSHSQAIAASPPPADRAGS